MILGEAATQTGSRLETPYKIRKGGPRNFALFFGHSLAIHALARLGYLVNDILADEVAGSQHPEPKGEIGAISPEPPARGGNHDYLYGSRQEAWMENGLRTLARLVVMV